MHEYRHLTRTLLGAYRRASPDEVSSGLAWYDTAYTVTERLAWRHGVDSVNRAAVALAHLSPRVRWEDNVRLLEKLLAGEPQPAQCFDRSWNAAVRALEADDPWLTFGRNAFKTRSFAQAICGDRNAVVVDIWTSRAAGAPEHLAKTVAGYVMVSDAYRRGARRVGISPRDLQSVVWTHARGSAL